MDMQAWRERADGGGRRARASLTEAGRRWARQAVAAVSGLGRPGKSRRAFYAALSIPLAAIYALVFLGLIASVISAVSGVGVLTFLALLAVTRGVGGFERRLARSLLGLDITPDARLRHERGALRRVRMLVRASSTWRALGWLGVRVLLGAGIFAALFFGLAAAGLLAFESNWTVWNALPLFAGTAAVVLLTILALDVQIRLAAAVAPRLLGVAAEEKLAALRETSHRLADRNRVARDLHDTIGHALTASLLQASAARVTLTPTRDAQVPSAAADFARQALEHIETNTRTALAELDRALAVLRDEREEPDPDGKEPAETSDLSGLNGLLAGLRDGGLPVTLTIEGDVDGIPADLSRLAFRVVQEGTTNVLRHAGCPATTVGVTRNPDTLVVRVHNEAADPPGSRPGRGGGRGLAGLRDRTAAAGGRLSAGQVASGGYELCATLPLPSRA